MKYVASSVVLLSLVCAGLAGAQAAPLTPAASSPFDVGSASGQVLLADLDRDGRLDLLTRHPATRTIRTHLGDGEARFETTETAVALTFTPAT